MQIFKRINSIRYFLLFIAINMVLSFLLEPASGTSGKMWREYYMEEELDTIFIGSSVCGETFNPYVFDQALGVKSFNMGTPLQALPQTLSGLEVAISDHNIETVVLGIGFPTLKYEELEEAELTFEHARIKEQSGLKKIVAGIKYLLSDEVRKDEKSILYFFPWIYNRIELSKDMLTLNATVKLERMIDGLEGENKLESGKGFQNDRTEILNYDNRWETNSFQYSMDPFNVEMMDSLAGIILLCKENDIDIVIINTPHPTFDTISCYMTYAKDHEQITSFCAEYGVDYYDFSLVKPELFEIKVEYFNDCEHMTREGAQFFCEKMCAFLFERETGRDIDKYFYTVEEFLGANQELLNEWIEY